MISFSPKLLLLLGTISLSSAAPSFISRGSSKPAAFFLAGDSTTAPDGGWGDGFINGTVKSPAIAHNYGHSGATTASFRAGGDWATVLSQVDKYNKSNEVYVTIQFGHNDQKSTSGVSLAQYSTNLANFAAEVKAHGGTPILVTPLTRRTFSGNKVVENLADQRNVTIHVATSTKTRYIDLNKASTDYVNVIGSKAASVYNLTPKDYTHLNEWGGVVFGRLVNDLLVAKYNEIAQWTTPNATMSHELSAGIPA